MIACGNQKGVSLIAAVFIIVIVGFMGVIFVTMLNTSSFTSLNDLKSTQALYVAEGGIESAVPILSTPNLANRIACTAVTGNANLTNEPLGSGQFTVAGAALYSQPTATLNGAINNTVNTINVDTTAGYAEYGRIMIDKELIDYSGTTPGAFTNALRGRDGTIAAPHAAGARVGQYQCSLTSTGDVPNAAASRARRTLQEGVQLQEGWAVGDNGDILRWNGTNWILFATTGENLRSVATDSYANGWTVGVLWPQPGQDYAQIRRWNPDGTPAWDLVGAPNLATVQLNSVHVLSHNEVWTVSNDRGGGANSLIFRWNGAWANFDSGVDANLNSIFMLDTDNDGVAEDGWAVGVATAGPARELVYRFTGAAWGRIAATVGIPNQTLMGVFCTSAADCWVVGAGGTIARWNGAAWANVGAPVAATLNSVYMLDTDGDGIAEDGWAVGNATGGELILRWNGAAWVRVGPSGLIPNDDLYGVSCVTSSDCWAVGENGTILHWNGTAWADFASPTGQDLRSVTIIGPRQRPQAAWQEVVN